MCYNKLGQLHIDDDGQKSGVWVNSWDVPGQKHMKLIDLDNLEMCQIRVMRIQI
jgi:hypothetical protein